MPWSTAAQWRKRLATHLNLDAGQIGGGKHRQTKVVDIAMVQTVTRSERAADLLEGYGLVVIDECHHVPAPTVERAVRNLDARRWLGLTATPQRPDGLKDIMVMQCGPIRHRITRSASDLDRQLQIHRTELTIRYRYPVATVIRWRDPAFCRVRLEGLSQRFACGRWLTSMADKVSCLPCG